MKFIGYILAVCLALAALRFVVMVLSVALAILLLWWTIRRPADVLAFLAMFSIVSVVNAYPWIVPGLAAIGLIIWAWKR